MSAINRGLLVAKALAAVSGQCSPLATRCALGVKSKITFLPSGGQKFVTVFLANKAHCTLTAARLRPARILHALGLPTAPHRRRSISSQQSSLAPISTSSRPHNAQFLKT